MANELKSLSLFLVPLAVLAVYLSGGEFQTAFGGGIEDMWEKLSVGISLAGVGWRVVALGRFENDGPAHKITLRGVNGLSRYPILASDLLIIAGFVLGTQVWWFSFVALAAVAACYYRSIRAAEDQALDMIHEKALQAAGTVPLRAVFQLERLKFSLGRGIANAYPSLFLVVVFTVLMEVAHDLSVGDATLTAWPPDWPFYFAALGLGCVGLGIWYFERRACAAGTVEVPARDAGPVTRGLRVDGRAGLVDTLENLISGGQQEKILDATLAAAEMTPGQAILDVGCGSGKLAVAACRQVGPQGSVTGVDATPAMIELARERGRALGSPARFQVGVAESLPFADGSLDAVTSSYFFHHLPSDVKRTALREMWRVLTPGGRLVITDYGKPQGIRGYVFSFPMRFDFHEYVRPQLKGELERMIAEENLGPLEKLDSFLGYINVLRLRKAAR